VPTRAQLTDQFTDVARLSRELSLLPEGQGGMLSVAVAKLAAKLKVCARGMGGRQMATRGKPLCLWLAGLRKRRLQD